MQTLVVQLKIIFYNVCQPVLRLDQTLRIYVYPFIVFHCCIHICPYKDKYAYIDALTTHTYSKHSMIINPNCKQHSIAISPPLTLLQICKLCNSSQCFIVKSVFPKQLQDDVIQLYPVSYIRQEIVTFVLFLY